MLRRSFCRKPPKGFKPMRPILMMVIALTATTEVSAQSFLQPTRHTTIYVDMSEPTVSTSWQELTGQRLWAPCQHGTWQWWRKVRIHRGAGWEMFAGQYHWFEDRIADSWVSEHSLVQSNQTKEQNDPVIRHQTINVWELRDKALREATEREQSTAPSELRDPKRFHEPVFRVPRTPVQPDPDLQEKQDDGWRASPERKEEKKPMKSRSRSSGPTMLCEHCSKLN